MLRFHSLRVLDISPDAEDAVAISLEVPSGLREEYRGSPGQHVVVRVEIAGEEARRTYSLVNAPGESPVRIVPRVHSQGRVSRYLAEELRPGDRLDVLTQNGRFTPREAGAAGGASACFAARWGRTAARTGARALLAQGASSVVLVYGN